MSKNKLRVISLILAFFTMAFIFNGCESKEPEVDDNTPSQSEPEVTPDDQGQENDEAKQPEYPEITTDEELKVYGVIAAVGNSGYELYTYLDGAAKNYASVISSVADDLSGICPVYDMVVPTSTGITLPDKYYDSITSSNQKESLDKIYGYLAPSVKPVNIYDTLMQHRDKKIYFRTDHHWTALGAYYAYREYCAAAGLTPTELSAHQGVEFTGFRGSFYEDSGEAEQLNDPESVMAYYPVGDVDMVFTDINGNEYEWPVIKDVTDYASSMKYNTFAAGDQPFTVLTNNSLSDGSVGIVVKESFGNAMVPFLADNYQTLYVIDYRYWGGDFKSFVQESGADQVLFINNISMTRSDYLIGKLSNAVR